MELHDAHPAKLLGDKGYDSDEIRTGLVKRGIEPVIPPRSNRTTPIAYDREAYKRRNLIERCVNRLKQFRRIATRYEKRPEPSSQCYVLQPQKSGSKLSTQPRCSVPMYNGTESNIVDKEGTGAKPAKGSGWRSQLESRAEGRLFTGAPARQRRSVERYNIVKRA